MMTASAWPVGFSHEARLLTTEFTNLFLVLSKIVFTTQYPQAGDTQTVIILGVDVFRLLRTQVDGLALAQQNGTRLTFKFCLAAGAKFGFVFGVRWHNPILP
jgi:hypothetical protein